MKPCPRRILSAYFFFYSCWFHSSQLAPFRSRDTLKGLVRQLRRESKINQNRRLFRLAWPVVKKILFFSLRVLSSWKIQHFFTFFLAFRLIAKCNSSQRAMINRPVESWTCTSVLALPVVYPKRIELFVARLDPSKGSYGGTGSRRKAISKLVLRLFSSRPVTRRGEYAPFPKNSKTSSTTLGEITQFGYDDWITEILYKEISFTFATRKNKKKKHDNKRSSKKMMEICILFH